MGMVSSQSRLFLTSLGTVVVQPPGNASVKARSTLLILRSFIFLESLGEDRTAHQHHRHGGAWGRGMWVGTQCLRLPCLCVTAQITAGACSRRPVAARESELPAARCSAGL